MTFKRNTTRTILLSLLMLLPILMLNTSVLAQDKSMHNPQKAARIDVCFLLDSTGSMSDEIEVVKGQIWEIVNEILLGDPKPDVRFSIVTYRDRSDEYLVKTFPMTRDVDQVHRDLLAIRADGGGDKREDVNAGFFTAVNELDWDPTPGTAHMIFLIGDAGPHMEYSQTVPYQTTATKAVEMGIQVFPIGCSGIDQLEVTEFTQIATLTGGEYEYLTYKADIIQDGEEKTLLITGDDASIAEPDSLSSYEWRRGGGKLRSEGKVRGAKKDEKVIYKDKETGEEREVVADEMGGAYNTQSMENNLDTVIRRQVQIQAEKQGAMYEKSELEVTVTTEITVKEKDDPWYISVWNWLTVVFK